MFKSVGGLSFLYVLNTHPRARVIALAQRLEYWSSKRNGQRLIPGVSVKAQYDTNPSDNVIN